MSNFFMLAINAGKNKSLAQSQIQSFEALWMRRESSEICLRVWKNTLEPWRYK